MKDIFVGMKEVSDIVRKGSPKQAQLLRHGALIILASYFEVLISELIQGYYLRFPAAMPADARLLSLADLREIGSIDEAEKLLIWKEVDSIIRESVENQLQHFSKRFKLDLKPIEQNLDHLIEVFQRRNLLVHNNGAVNKIYLHKTPSSLLEQEEIKEGDTLPVTESYLSQAINVVSLCGNILLHLCWQKWEKKDSEASEKWIVNQLYEALKDQDYEMVIQFAKYAANFKFSVDINFRIILINHAIALKETGKIKEMEELLGTTDWTSCNLQFRLALLALRDKIDEFFDLLPKVIIAENLDDEAMNEWPLFNHIRDDPRFAKAFSDHFDRS